MPLCSIVALPSVVLHVPVTGGAISPAALKVAPERVLTMGPSIVSAPDPLIIISSSVEARAPVTLVTTEPLALRVAASNVQPSFQILFQGPRYLTLHFQDLRLAYQ